MLHTFPYLILFLPLIASVFCFLVNFKKSDFLIFITTTFLILILTLKLSLDFNEFGEIKNDAGFGILSIPTEYRIDFLAIFFLATILILQILLSFFYRANLTSALKNDNRQLFYGVWILNLFGCIGIIITNNIFNLFVFIEIYCLTFCGIISISNDHSLSKLAFKYFCGSVLSSILLLLSLILLYIFSGNLHIDQIDNLLEFDNSNLIFWLICISLFIKFFPLHIYFKILKSDDILANFLLNFVFIISGCIGFYLLLRLSLFMFMPDKIFLILFTTLGFLIIFYSNYKLLKFSNIRNFATYLCFTNFGFILISITFLSDNSLNSALFYVINYATIGLISFLFANHLNKSDSLLIKLLKVPTIIIILLNLPIALMFWANWNLVLLAFDFKTGILTLIPIATTNSVFIVLIFKTIQNMNTSKNPSDPI